MFVVELMGFGVCYIGGLCNELEEVSKLLKLFYYVILLFGLIVGYLVGIMDKKLCLLFKYVYYEEIYELNDE